MSVLLDRTSTLLGLVFSLTEEVCGVLGVRTVAEVGEGTRRAVLVALNKGRAAGMADLDMISSSIHRWAGK